MNEETWGSSTKRRLLKSRELKGRQEFGIIEGNELKETEEARTPDEGGRSEGKGHSRVTGIPHWDL